MTWNQNVSGGVGPAVLEACDAAGRSIINITFPSHATLRESFDVVTVRRTAVAGTLVDVPRGYRYRGRVELAFATVTTWRNLTAALGYWRAGGRLRFYPHDDGPRIHYDVVPAADFSFPYAAGKYVGYAGTLELVGTELLPFIPAAWDWSYFCAAGETGYNPGEITYFGAAGETTYDEGEVGYFSSAAARG